MRSRRMRCATAILAGVASLTIAGLARAQPAGAEVEVAVAGGAPFIGYVAGSHDAAAAVLIVHDWFGVSDFTRETVTRFAALGYRVLAVDLYGGESATTHERAGELMGGLEDDRVQAVLKAGLQALRGGARPVAAMGFSMGGGPAFGLSMLEPGQVSATVVIYGGSYENAEVDDLRRGATPVLAVTGSRDKWALDSALAALPKMEAAGRPLELYVYPGAKHAYAQPLYNDGANYDATATRVTWQIVDDFLERHLTGVPAAAEAAPKGDPGR